MKRIIAISLSLAMVFALFGAMTVSVTAEDDVEWTVFKSADKGDLPSLSQNVKHISISSVSNSFSSIDSTNIWKLALTDNMGGAVNFSFDAGTLTDVTDIRLWAGVTDTTNNGGFDIVLITPDVNYAYNVSLDTTGKTVTLSNKTFLTATTQDYGGFFKKVEGTSYKFSEIDMSAVTMIQIQRRYNATLGSQKGTMYFDRIEIAKPAASEVTSSTIEMADGAAMRIDGATNGIRFDASVDKTAFDNLVGENAEVTEIGTLIAKKGTALNDVVVENAVDTSTSAKELANGEIPVAKYAENATMKTVEKSGKYVIYGSLVGINENKNANQQYVARAYVKYTKDGKDYVLYAKELSEPRSIAQVANSISKDSEYYKSLCDKHKAVVDNWADKYDESQY